MTDAILTVEQMRAAEQAAMAAGTDGWELMQRAGRGAAEWVARIAAGRPVSVLCGPGNNGGDGYVIAETLRRGGLGVEVIAPLALKTETAQIARDHYAGDVASDAMPRHAITVDCLFGYGLTRAVEGQFTDLLEFIAASDCHKIAIDVPSAVESDSGAVLGPLPHYDLTLALGAWKLAHGLMPAMAAMGARRLVPIGIDIPDTGMQFASPPQLRAPSPDEIGRAHV